MDHESQLHTMFKTSGHTAPRIYVTHRKSLGTAKATELNELLMVLAPRVGSSKGHYKELESSSEEGKQGTRENEAR